MICFGEHLPNQAAYLRLKDSIAAEYPRGWFVAIADEKVVGAAETVLALGKLENSPQLFWSGAPKLRTQASAQTECCVHPYRRKAQPSL